MNGTWPDLRNPWERLRWARLRAGFERAKDAAESLGLKPGTYRTYEYDPDKNGREPPLSELIRFSRKFKVNWIWVASGEGIPFESAPADPRVTEIARKAAEVADDKRDDALDAAISVLDSYIRKSA